MSNVPATKVTLPMTKAAKVEIIREHATSVALSLVVMLGSFLNSLTFVIHKDMLGIIAGDMCFVFSSIWFIDVVRALLRDMMDFLIPEDTPQDV